MATQHKTPAIVLGTCINGLGVIRTLGRNGVPVIAVTQNGSEFGSRSRYLKELWHLDGAEDQIIDSLLQRSHLFDQRPVLFPVVDRWVRGISARRADIAEHYRIQLPDAEVLEAAMSKTGFARLCSDLGLTTPQTLLAESTEQVCEASKRVQFPCIVKPEFHTPDYMRAARAKAFRVTTADELIRVYATFSRVQPQVIIQEWIPGEDGEIYFCLQYYDAKSRRLASFRGRKIRQWPPLTGTGCSIEPARTQRIEDLADAFFSGLDFRGLGSLEFKRDVGTGEFVAIEATVGRTDFNGAVADLNGVPIPYIAYCDLVGLPQRRWRQSRVPVKWVRWSADKASARHYRRKGELSVTGWLWSIRPLVGWSVWSMTDPWPCVHYASGQLKANARGILRKLQCRSTQDEQADAQLSTHSALKCRMIAWTAPIRLIAKAWAYYREYGPRDFIYRIHRRRKFIVYIKRLERVPRVHFADDIQFRIADQQDIPRLCQLLKGYWGTDPREEIRARLDQGDTAIVGFFPSDESQFVFASWLSHNDWLYHTLFGTEAGSRHLCSRRIWVPPAFRGQGIATRGVQFAESVARHAGAEQLIAFVYSRNKNSQVLHERLSYQKCGVLRVGRVLGKTFSEFRKNGQRKWQPLQPDASARTREIAELVPESCPKATMLVSKETSTQ